MHEGTLQLLPTDTPHTKRTNTHRQQTHIQHMTHTLPIYNIQHTEKHTCNVHIQVKQTPHSEHIQHTLTHIH